MGSSGLITGAFSSDTTLPTPVPINKGGTGQTTAQAAIDALTAVSGASTNQVLTKDGSGNAVFAAASAGWVGTATSNLDMDTYNIFDIDFLQLSAPTELTISTGAVTFSQSYHSVDTEADASSDNLDYFNGLTMGQFLVLKSVDNSRDVVLRSGATGDAKMNGVNDYTLADIDYRWTGLADTSVSNFVINELSRSSNTA